MKDLLYRNKNPVALFARKYGSLKGRPLDARVVRLYGRQILEALRFLHDKGIPYGHLHAGNVMIIADSVCRLTDLENGVLGLPAYHRAFITEIRRIQV